MNNIKTIIVDDEPKAIGILERYIARISSLILLNSFRDPSEGVAFTKNNKVDLVLLDINMPGMSGVEFSKLCSTGTQIIFTTAYPEFAAVGFDLNVTDYLVKPIEFERFEKAINKVTGSIQKNISHTINEDVLFFKSGTKIYKTDIPEILIFEKEGNYFKIHLKNGKNILIRMNFTDLLEILPSHKFIRVHKSYIVSIKNIDLIESDEIIINKHRIPIGSNFKSNLDVIFPGNF